MADFQAVAAVGESMVRFLNLSFDEDEPVPGNHTSAVLARTEDLVPSNQATVIVAPALSIFLFRVGYNETMRPAWSAVGHQQGRSHLPLDLHFLLTPWAANATFEQRILGRAMQALDSSPILSGPLLVDNATGWSPNEAVQICLENLSTEDVMRTFDSLPADYKLSVSYMVRIIRIDERRAAVAPPVTSAITGSKPSLAP
ncbi:DUF4255 domain-containing protein [Nitrococcus mobilis]|uniref:Pvc16 N-terminal domain-containing protein n=1 Tax=Nitrococcus mobilis Nb-231 TaxID=314278 RepID=A4BR18_9GAMM|nr:DUF4255 domain-containing protein [Nitrococcus mobilis]EAR22018.1 hypothetical protein NB231_06506 [Nitrococcus mobilis Nb-231]